MVKRETDVLIVGAGPVGMFAALSLVERGLDVQVVDKDWRGTTHSYALALHPQSLRLLDEHGAAGELLERGYKVERLAIYKDDERVGELDFTKLGGTFPFLLVAPQSVLEHSLEKCLEQHKVKVLWNHQALRFQSTLGHVRHDVFDVGGDFGQPLFHPRRMCRVGGSSGRRGLGALLLHVTVHRSLISSSFL